MPGEVEVREAGGVVEVGVAGEWAEVAGVGARVAGEGAEVAEV